MKITENMICSVAKEQLMKAVDPNENKPYNEFECYLIVKSGGKKYISINGRDWEFTEDPNHVVLGKGPTEHEIDINIVPIKVQSFINDLRESLISKSFIMQQVGIGDKNYIYKTLKTNNPYTLSEHEFIGEKHFDLKINLGDKVIEYTSVTDPRLGGIVVRKEIPNEMFEKEGVLVNGFYKSETHIVARGTVDLLGDDEIRIDDKSYTIKKVGDRYNIELSPGFGSNMLAKPFGGYKNFKDCVEHNRDKKDPDAYCATIMRDVEGKK